MNSLDDHKEFSSFAHCRWHNEYRFWVVTTENKANKNNASLMKSTKKTQQYCACITPW